MHKFGKAAVAVAATVTAVTGVGVAVAGWTANGSGSGTATATQNHTVTLTAATSGSADLYPGAYGDVKFTVTNSDAWTKTMTQVTGVSISNVVGDALAKGGSACSSSNFTLPTPGGSAVSSTNPFTITSFDVAGSASGATVTIPASDHLLKMNSDAPDACQGTTVTLSLTLSGAQKTS